MKDFNTIVVTPKKKLWEQIKEIEDAYTPDAQDELGRVRATLLVNFGPHAHHTSKFGGILKTEHGSTLHMLMEVFTELFLRVDALEKRSEILKPANEKEANT